MAWESTLPSGDKVAQIAIRDGARPWQVEILAEPIGDALRALLKEPASK
ncbi:hypothetical protein ACRWC8_24305 [Escherichia coli]